VAKRIQQPVRLLSRARANARARAGYLCLWLV
jgi:hypothetical protein